MHVQTQKCHLCWSEASTWQMLRTRRCSRHLVAALNGQLQHPAIMHRPWQCDCEITHVMACRTMTLCMHTDCLHGIAGNSQHSGVQYCILLKMRSDCPRVFDCDNVGGDAASKPACMVRIPQAGDLLSRPASIRTCVNCGLVAGSWDHAYAVRSSRLAGTADAAIEPGHRVARRGPQGDLFQTRGQSGDGAGQ